MFICHRRDIQTDTFVRSASLPSALSSWAESLWQSKSTQIKPKPSPDQAQTKPEHSQIKPKMSPDQAQTKPDQLQNKAKPSQNRLRPSSEEVQTKPKPRLSGGLAVLSGGSHCCFVLGVPWPRVVQRIYDFWPWFYVLFGTTFQVPNQTTFRNDRTGTP